MNQKEIRETVARLEAFLAGLPQERRNRWQCVVNMHGVGTAYVALAYRISKVSAMSEEAKSEKMPPLVFAADALGDEFRANLAAFRDFAGRKGLSRLEALQLAQQGYEKLLADGCLVPLLREDLDAEIPLDLVALKTLLDIAAQSAAKLREKPKKG